MTVESAFVLLIGLLATTLFVTERLRVDVVAMLVMVSFISAGIISPEQGISGFSNPATVTVAAMFVLAAALEKTGALDSVAALIMRLSGKSLFRATFLLMTSVGFISAFVNNTAAVAVFLPITLELSRRANISPSKLLIPLSFASLFGGACTLIGTSTNVLVSTLSVQHGDKAFAMFEMAPLGLIMAAAGMIYMLTFGLWILPKRRSTRSVEAEYALEPYLTEVVLGEPCESIGKNLVEAPLLREHDLDILEIQRGRLRIRHPSSMTVLEDGDRLRVRCTLDSLQTLPAVPGVELHPLTKSTEGDDFQFMEAVLAPNSSLCGETLQSINFRERFKATAVALRRHGKNQHSKLGSAILHAGDVLLIAATSEARDLVKRSGDFVLCSEITQRTNRQHLALFSVSILIGVVLLTSFNVLPIVASALLGCAILTLAGAVTPDEVYEAIDWKVIMLLGGMLTLGQAMQESGTDKFLAQGLEGLAGAFGPWLLVSALYLITSLLTEVLSNNATAVLLVPVAFSAAESIGIDPKPLLMAITFAASASFMTPVGYQTNTLVYGPGQYKYADYLKVGTPLNLLFWIIASFMIPILWPFHV